MRTAAILVAVVAFTIAGGIDVSNGSYRTGAASLMLAAVNWLLLT